MNGGWGKGSGACGNNCNGAVDLNSSGGFKVPGSRYQNEVLVSGNQFVNNWEGIDIWQAGARSCENSGEGWPNDTAYCSGGFPNSTATAAGGQYYFSHEGDSAHGGVTTLAQPAAAGSSTVLVGGSVAIDDQIGFADPRSTKTSDRTGVATFTGAGTINATTAGFPSSGQLRVGTSAAWADGGGSYTGAILSYRGTTPTSFTGVSLVRGSGSLAGPIREVQPYKVTAEKCYANDCAVTVSPPLAAPQVAGAAGQQCRDLPALRHELGAALRTPRSRRHFLLGRLPVGGQEHLRDRQRLPVRPIGHRIQRSPGRWREDHHVHGGTQGRLRDQLHGVPGIRGGAVRYADGRERDDEQFVLYRVPIMGLRLHDESAVQPERSRQPAGSAAQSRGAG